MRTRNLYQPGDSAPFKLSRSKLEAFQNCPRCFYLDRRLGIEPPGGPPFTLNSAVDTLLKKEFDRYRADGKPHPYMTKAGLDAIPYAHPKLNEWRQNFKGVRHVHKPSGFELSGAIDDLWQDRATGEIIVADYKATAKATEVSLDADWQISYKRQMEFYQWLLRQNGLRVSRTGYFVYCNGDVSASGFDSVMRFKVSLLPYEGDASWVEPTLLQARACLDEAAPPPAAADCEQCAYLTDAAKVALR